MGPNSRSWARAWQPVKGLHSFLCDGNPEELERFFFLDDEDRKLVAKRRGDANWLGFALPEITS